MRKLLDRIALKLGYVPDTIERTLHCAWCTKEFTWSGPTATNHALYCSRLHQKRAKEARAKRRNARNPQPEPKKKSTPPTDMSRVGRCPTPYKETHITFEKAKEVIRRVDPKMHAYRCPCGAIHIGH